jgi:hypothetical protein
MLNVFLSSTVGEAEFLYSFEDSENLMVEDIFEMLAGKGYEDVNKGYFKLDSANKSVMADMENFSIPTINYLENGEEKSGRATSLILFRPIAKKASGAATRYELMEKVKNILFNTTNPDVEAIFHVEPPLNRGNMPNNWYLDKLAQYEAWLSPEPETLEEKVRALDYQVSELNSQLAIVKAMLDMNI